MSTISQIRCLLPWANQLHLHPVFQNSRTQRALMLQSNENISNIRYSSYSREHQQHFFPMTPEWRTLQQKSSPSFSRGNTLSSSNPREENLHFYKSFPPKTEEHRHMNETKFSTQFDFDRIEHAASHELWLYKDIQNHRWNKKYVRSIDS